MHYGLWLFQRGYISHEDFRKVLRKQWEDACPDKAQDHGYLTSPLPSVILDPIRYRMLPFGSVLDDMSTIADAVYSRSKKNARGLFEEYCEWHAHNLEPISDYTLECKFANQLYVQQLEKKLIATFLVKEKVRNQHSLIVDGDIVVLLEGSTSFYTGLAATWHLPVDHGDNDKGVDIVTSNGGLVREFYENPVVRRRLKSLRFVGGDPDYNHRGFIGPDAQNEYTQAIKYKPGATVVVSSVTGLIPEHGPMGPSGKANMTRLHVLEIAREAAVRAIIFVADWTKLLGSLSSRYGEYIYTRQGLNKLVDGDGSQVYVVTCPPPKSCQDAPAALLPHLPKSTSWSQIEIEYNHSLQWIRDRLGSTSGNERVFEVARGQSPLVNVT